MAKERNIFCGYCEVSENCAKHFLKCDKHKNFANIATGQRKIDIDRACEVLKELTDDRLGKTFIEQFKKAMKEQL